jgi:hypothetical protein
MQKIKQFDKKNHEQFVNNVKAFFRENPVFARAYEQQVKNCDDRFQRDSSELAEKARAYAKAHDVDFKTATKAVLRDNADLRDSWHFAGQRPDKATERRYQDDSDPEPDSAARLLAEGRKVKAAIGISLMDALLRVAREDHDLSKAVAGDFISEKVAAKIGAEKDGSPTRLVVVREIVKEHPAIGDMWNSGGATEQALREIFGDELQD